VEKSKLDEIRDELAIKHFEGELNRRWHAKDFAAGWDAAMERVKPLLEILEDFVEHEIYSKNVQLLKDKIKFFKGEL